MFVKMLKTVAMAKPHGLFEAGKVYEVADAMGAILVRSRQGEMTVMPPTLVSDFLAKLDQGAGETCLFLPYLGEFGHMVMSHLRMVHWHKAGKKIVCCRKGEEVLYPSASEFFTDWVHPVPDSCRCQTGTPRHWPAIEAKYPGARLIMSGGLGRTEQRIVVAPGKRIPFKSKRRGLNVDVCIGTRFRQIGAERNWFHWQAVANALVAAGYTFAVIGSRPTAPDLVGQKYHSGDYDTDAALELLQSCQLYLGSDSGNTHLAASVGANVRLIKGHDGDGYIPIMEKANPGRVSLIDGGWDNPELVIQEALRTLGAG